MSDDKKWSEKEEIAWRYGIMKGEEQERSRFREMVEKLEKNAMYQMNMFGLLFGDEEIRKKMAETSDVIGFKKKDWKELLAEIDAEKDRDIPNPLEIGGEDSGVNHFPDKASNYRPSETSRCGCDPENAYDGNWHNPDCPLFEKKCECGDFINKCPCPHCDECCMIGYKKFKEGKE